jgi:hypothetical protein
MRFAIPHLLPSLLPCLVLPCFLKALLSEKRELRINILIWNFAALYAAEREWNSAAKFTRKNPTGLVSVSTPAFP